MIRVDNESQVKLLESILESLKEANGNELSHIEIKENNIDPSRIGQTISGIANTCTYEDKDKGYLVYGIRDSHLDLVGVNFDPFNLKDGNQSLELKLRQMILGTDFQFTPLKHQGKDFLIIKISKSLGRIATYCNKAYLRVGSNTTELSKYPEREKKIWSKLDKLAFWRMSAMKDVEVEDVFELLDYNAYYRLIKLPVPQNKASIIERFKQETFIKSDEGGMFITNLGALLFANDMKRFPTLHTKHPE